MAFVATLIAHPSNPVLTPALAERAVEAVKTSGLYWLADGIACDIALHDDQEPEAAEASIRQVLADAPVDLVVQQAETRRKRFLIADMDSTMIGQECIDELADVVGLKDKVAAITARAMNGEIAFEPALRERVALLRDLPVGTINDVIENHISLAPGGRELVATMNAQGAHTALVSGGFTAFTSVIAERLGFAENRANILLTDGDKLSGTVAEPILGAEAKLAALREIASTLSLSPSDVMAVGDGANDLPMILEAGTGVAIHAKPAVAAKAPFRIDHGDLTALLFMQGYRASEFHTR